MRTLLIGLDAFEPNTFERLHEQGRLPNLGKFVDAKGYQQFAVTNPPQSEVSWTSIATGLNPGTHGLFDFVHREPTTYSLGVSLLPTKQGFGGTSYVPPYTSRTIFDQAVKQGYPATALWWPAMFPARPESPVHTLPGLGTPDILGRLGVGTFFSTIKELVDEKERKTPISILNRSGDGRYIGKILGPIRKRRGGTEAASQSLELEMIDKRSGRLRIGKQVLELRIGQWSPIVELSFKLGFMMKMQALTRFILTEAKPEPSLYALPLQIHPLHTPWRYATPRGFVRKTWQACGPFLTLGWPQDTTALEEGYINDDQFLNLCDSVFSDRERVLMHQIESFNEGILACVFDTLDRVQHMFWHDRPDIIEGWYEKFDALVGRIEERLRYQGLKDNTQVVIVSDHGFTRFDHKVHLNRWLIKRGYLVPQENGIGESGDLQQADWTKSQAYAIGLNSIYLNLAGREGQGIVLQDEQNAILDKLCDELSQWLGPDGTPVVGRAYKNSEAFDGPLVEYGPDIVVGFSPGYRASQKTGLGAWEKELIEPNRDHWGADHCIDANSVPGVIFSKKDLTNFPNPSYRDIPALTIGAAPDAGGSAPPPPPTSDEDEKIIEERLKSLGYL